MIAIILFLCALFWLHFIVYLHKDLYIPSPSNAGPGYLTQQHMETEVLFVGFLENSVHEDFYTEISEKFHNCNNFFPLFVFFSNNP